LSLQRLDLSDRHAQEFHVVPNLASQNPRSNSVASELRRKRGLLRIRRIAKLTAFVRALRRSHGADRVPDFDPTEAGTNARILILLEAPGPRATKARGGSGFVSADNNDGTAGNLRDFVTRAYRSSGYAFASLPASTNGTFLYCSDCTIASPCASGGTGALAKRLNSVWVCN